MALESSEVRSFGGGSGKVYVNTNLTAGFFPSTLSDPINRADGWIEVGHIGEEGPAISIGQAPNPQRSWQSYPDPVRTLQGEAVTTVSFNLQQWNRYTLDLALGGGTWTDDGGGDFTFTPSASSVTDPRAVILEGVDGDYTYRFLFFKAEQRTNVDITWNPTELAELPIQMTVLSPDASVSPVPFKVQTDDPNAGTDEAAS